MTKPYEFIVFVAMDATKPYEFIGTGAMDLRAVMLSQATKHHSDQIHVHRNPMNLQGLGPSMSLNHIELYGLVTSMAPHPINL